MPRAGRRRQSADQDDLLTSAPATAARFIRAKSTSCVRSVRLWHGHVSTFGNDGIPGTRCPGHDRPDAHAAVAAG
jgi:hypothetical protein